MKPLNDNQIFLKFLNSIKTDFKTNKEVQLNFKKVLQFLDELHIEESEALKLAEITFRSARTVAPA